MISILPAIYNILESRGSYLARIDVEEEANFLIKKMQWAVSESDFIIQPAVDATSTSLSINKKNFPDNPVAISLMGQDVGISYASSSPVILNSSNVSVKDLTFTQISGYAYPAIKISLTLEYRLDDLKSMKPSTTLETTIFLRNL